MSEASCADQLHNRESQRERPDVQGSKQASNQRAHEVLWNLIILDGRLHSRYGRCSCTPVLECAGLTFDCLPLGKHISEGLTLPCRTAFISIRSAHGCCSVSVMGNGK